jgi:Tfp pilus assembly protein FimV
LDWRDKKLEELAQTVRQLEDQLRAKESEVQVKDAELRAKEAELREKENDVRVLPEAAELEIYRLRSRLNRSIARAEEERLHRMEIEDTISAP